MNTRFAYATFLVFALSCARLSYAAGPTPTPNATPTPKPLRIGVILSLSGQYSDLGMEARNGMELARSENVPMGVASVAAPEVIYADIASDSTPAKLSEAFKRLIVIDHVQAIIGDVKPETSISIIAPANTYRVPYILLSVFDINLPPDNQFAFTIYPKQQSIEKGYKSFFEANRDVKTLTLFCSSSDRGLVYRSMIKDIAEAQSVKIVDELCGSETTYDFRVNVLRASSANPAAVFLGFNPELAIRWMSSFTFHPKLLATDDVAIALKQRGLSNQDAEGIFYVDWPLNEAFVRAYETRYAATPLYMGYLGYEAMRSILKAYEKSPYDVRSGLKSLRYMGASGEINFTNDQAVNLSQAALMKVKNGQGNPAQ